MMAARMRMRSFIWEGLRIEDLGSGMFVCWLVSDCGGFDAVDLDGGFEVFGGFGEVAISEAGIAEERSAIDEAEGGGFLALVADTFGVGAGDEAGGDDLAVGVGGLVENADADGAEAVSEEIGDDGFAGGLVLEPEGVEGLGDGGGRVDGGDVEGFESAFGGEDGDLVVGHGG